MRHIVGLRGVFLAPLLCAASVCAGAQEIVAHRGANHLAPENTRAAAEKALELGADYIEADVRQSSDGEFYIIHDANVSRTTNGRGAVAQMTSAELDQLDAGSWFGPEFAGERLPKVREYLVWIKGKAKVYIDFKSGDIAKMIELVRETGFENECFFWFGDDSILARFRELDKDLPLKINASTPEELAAADRWNASIVECTLSSLTPEFVAACRERGVRIMVYEPIEKRELVRKFLEAPVDLINTDRPEWFAGQRRAAADASAKTEGGR